MEGASVETNRRNGVAQMSVWKSTEEWGDCRQEARWMFQESRQEDVHPEKATTWGQGREEEAHLRELEMAPASGGHWSECRGVSDSVPGRTTRTAEGTKKVFRTLSVPDWELRPTPSPSREGNGKAEPAAEQRREARTRESGSGRRI